MIETTVLSNLLHNEQYMRKVIPFLKDEYFEDHAHKAVYGYIRDYIDSYNDLPTNAAVKLIASEATGLNEDRYKKVQSLLKDIEKGTDEKLEWLLDVTEEFCQERALHNAIRKSILVLEGQIKELDKGSLPSILSEALGVSFDTAIGHDFIEDSELRFELYHKVEERVPFGLEIFDKITKGGIAKKSLSVALSSTGVGKTLFMCNYAANVLARGGNVLYVTMEMAEERIAERIDANLLDVTIDALHELPKDVYDKKINRLKAKTKGRLIIKEYPTTTAGSNHFRHLINELRLKKKFIPDIIFIDYLNICASSRMKMGSNVNSYTFIKAIAEELRGLSVEFNLPIFTATQTNRSGAQSTDVELTDTAESYGLPATADFFFALTSTEELEAMGQLMIKQLKNRWNDLNYYKRFTVGIDRSKMRLFDVEESAQKNIMNDTPVIDRGGDKHQPDKKKRKFDTLN